MHGHGRAIPVIGERDRGGDLDVAVDPAVPCIALARHDLEHRAVGRELRAVGRAHHHAERAAGPQVDLEHGERERRGREPALDVLGLRERLPHERARRRERAGQVQLRAAHDQLVE